jgi:hypothetical protein
MAISKTYNYLVYKHDRAEHNTLFSDLYTETVDENPVKTPKSGNENLFDELGEDYSKKYCHVITIEYTAENRNSSGNIVESYEDKTVRHFIPCDDALLMDNQPTFQMKRATEIVSATDNTKFINKDEIALVGYDRAT